MSSNTTSIKGSTSVRAGFDAQESSVSPTPKAADVTSHGASGAGDVGASIPSRAKPHRKSGSRGTRAAEASAQLREDLAGALAITPAPGSLAEYSFSAGVQPVVKTTHFGLGRDTQISQLLKVQELAQRALPEVRLFLSSPRIRLTAPAWDAAAVHNLSLEYGSKVVLEAFGADQVVAEALVDKVASVLLSKFPVTITAEKKQAQPGASPSVVSELETRFRREAIEAGAILEEIWCRPGSKRGLHMEPSLSVQAVARQFRGVSVLIVRSGKGVAAYADQGADVIDLKAGQNEAVVVVGKGYSTNEVLRVIGQISTIISRGDEH